MSELPEARRYERFDFHSHTYLTDGTASATEMWRQAEHLEHRALAVTDHIALDDPGPLLERLRQEARAWEGTALTTLIGVEVTHVPPSKIERAVRAARRAGAEIVIVHGETLAENVVPGTNRAALELGEVDVLAHPGLLTVEDAELAKSQGTILELSGRRGHSLSNGRVARVALEVGAALCVDSDAHAIDQLLASVAARRVAEGAGLLETKLEAVLEGAPRALLKRVGRPV
jgi:putative hydrolase